MVFYCESWLLQSCETRRTCNDYREKDYGELYETQKPLSASQKHSDSSRVTSEGCSVMGALG
jgi:hypothetical protein